VCGVVPTLDVPLEGFEAPRSVSQLRSDALASQQRSNHHSTVAILCIFCQFSLLCALYEYPITDLKRSAKQVLLAMLNSLCASLNTLLDWSLHFA
jgi:hypothetical protein